ncbi:MAG: peptidoglycan-binding domain-containing protein [Acidimicrobiales bacterium]|jgi:hypothetical protein
MVTFEAPVTLESATVVFSSLNLTHRLKVGYLNPVDTDSGVFQRLDNLGYTGYAHGAVDGPGHLLQIAIVEFQRAQELPMTGEIDDATRARLQTAHGC